MARIELNKRTPFKESAVNLALLAYILDKAAPFLGKTKIIKTAFRIELALRESDLIGPTFRFYRYKHGPFSVELLDAYDALRFNGFAKNFALTDRGKRLARFAESLKKHRDNQPVFEIMDEVLQQCRNTHGWAMADDLYKVPIRPEHQHRRLLLKDIEEKVDLVAPKGMPNIRLPEATARAITDELQITDEDIKRTEQEWPAIEARALSRLHAAINAGQPEE